LQRSIDLSVAPVTRPETLALLKAGTAEAVRLVNGWGKGNSTRIDPLFVAETPDSIAALGHFRQLAIALGYAVEPVADHNIAEGHIVRVRDAQMLAHDRFAPALDAWLARLAVHRFDQATTALSIRKDGGTRITCGGVTAEAGHAVFASDEAILRYLPADALDRSLVPIQASATLLEGLRLPAPFVAWLDRGVAVAQEPRSMSLSAVTTGALETARARLGSAVARHGPLRLAGETVLSSLRTSDGTPFVGNARGVRATLAAGLGLAGAFLAPALARHLVGAASATEAEWFASRGPARGNHRLASADYQPVPA
jgi:hypothetical protein